MDSVMFTCPHCGHQSNTAVMKHDRACCVACGGFLYNQPEEAEEPFNWNDFDEDEEWDDFDIDEEDEE